MKAARYSVELDGDPTADGTQSVRMVISKYGRVRYRIGLKVLPGQWDPRKQCVKFGAKDHLLVNARIGKALERARAIEHQHPHLDAKGIKAKLEHKAPAPMSFAALMALDLAETPPKSPNTVEVREVIIRKFARWNPDITVQQVTSMTMERWFHDLQKTISHNGAVTQVQVIRTLYRRCCRRVGIAPLDILHGVGATAKAGKPSQLTADEVADLAAYAETQTGWRAKAVHMWMFGYLSCGMRWGDLCTIKRENIEGGRVTLYAQGKTEAYKSVPLRAAAKEIADRYTVGEYLFGIGGSKHPTEQRIKSARRTVNKHLKAAAKACGIEKRMHTHNNRHSFAGEALARKVDDRAAALAMGLSERMFRQHYRGNVDQKVVDEAAAVVFKRE